MTTNGTSFLLAIAHTAASSTLFMRSLRSLSYVLPQELELHAQQGLKIYLVLVVGFFLSVVSAACILLKWSSSKRRNQRIESQSLLESAAGADDKISPDPKDDAPQKHVH